LNMRPNERRLLEAKGILILLETIREAAGKHMTDHPRRADNLR